MYLRLGWVVGYAGVPLALVVITLANLVTLITTLSMSAIATNGEVHAGGAYFLISRSLGPAAGSAIGILFSIGLSVAIALYIVGLAETASQLLFEMKIIDKADMIPFIRVIGSATLALSLLMVLGGVGWIIKLQLGLLAIILVSIVFFVWGTLSSSTAPGWTGFSYKTFQDSMLPRFTSDVNFFTVFSVAFPMSTGILAGANISGDLRDPSEAIPKGTLSAIGFSWVVYCFMAAVLGFTIVPDTLKTNFLIQADVSLWAPIVIIGIFLATFSSALASLVGAPRIFMAVCQDKLFKHRFFSTFSKTYGKEKDPIPGYFLAAIIAWACVMVGDLNFVAPIISNFFMLTYALINYACFSASVSKSPAWRPSFKYFNQWVALAGFVLCVAIMFAMDPWVSLLTLILAAIIFKYIEHSSPDVEFGSWNVSYRHLRALKTLLDLRSSKMTSKSWRPHFLVLSGNPEERLYMVNFVSQFSKGYGLVVCGHVTKGELHKTDIKAVQQRGKTIEEYFLENNIKAFYQPCIAPDFRSGVQSLIQLTGIGRLTTNTVVMGFKKDWFTDKPDNCEQYVSIIRDCFHLRYGVLLGRNLSSVNFALPNGPTGTVDIWWLVDDGGLTILLPYLLRKKKYWNNIRLRIFTVTSNPSGISPETLAMISLLKKLRLSNVCDVIPVEGGSKPPSKKSLKQFVKLGILPPKGDPLRDRCYRYLRLGELLQEHSKRSEMVFISLPFPRQNVNAKLYMSWLEVMSQNLPPTIMLRGNQESVLSFYI